MYYKIIERAILSSIFYFIVSSSIAQCPVLDGAMVNSCGTNEGANEFAIFTTSRSNPVSAYNVYYGQSNPPNSSGNKVLPGAAASTKTGPGVVNSLCCKIKEITAPTDFIPANSRVVFIPSAFDCVYNISSLCIGDTIYVVYIDATNPLSNWTVTGGGNIANYPSSRYLQVVDILNNCPSDVRSYDSSIWPSNSDGNTVTWDDRGNAIGINNGCDFGPSAPAISISNPSVCIGTPSINLPFTIVGCPDKFSLTWDAAALAAGFINLPISLIPPSPINIAIPVTATAGIYLANLYIENSLSGNNASQLFTITIANKPVAVLPININTIVCNNETVNPTSFSSIPAGAVFTWTNSNTTIGLSGAGTGYISSFVATNTSASPQVSTILVTPNINGCVGLPNSYSITVNPSIFPLFTQPSTICYGNTFTLPSVSTNGISGLWSPSINDTYTTTYTFIPSSNQGACIVPTILTVNVHKIIADAGIDQNVAIGNPYQLNGSGGISNLQYSWTPAIGLNNPNISNPIAILNFDTRFYLLVSDSAGCEGRDSVFIRVYKDIGFYVPKAFTPNGDGINDIFRPIPVSISSIEYFRIFNRFGNKVFETTNVYMGWDGRFNNNKQNTDTYIYIIKGTTLDGKEVVLKGSFLLIN